MARELSSAQIDEVAEALRAAGDVAEPRDLHKIVKQLRESQQSAFTDADLESIQAAIATMEQGLEAKPQWQTRSGRGSFIVFEGLDRSGKSTQSKMLREHLEKASGPDRVKWRCFPNRATAVGCLINLYLQRKIELSDAAVHLLFSANRWEEAAGIVEDLASGVSVVCDRYAFSGVAYSVAKGVPGLDFDWCQAPDRGLPCPDAVFFMRVDPEVGAKRAAYGDERYENQTMQASVRAEFQQPRLHSGVAWHTVDGSRTIEEIHREICETVAGLQQGGQEDDGRPIGRLWVQG